MKTVNLNFRFATAIFSLILVSCGGGGSGSNSPSTSTAPATTAQPVTAPVTLDYGPANIALVNQVNTKLALIPIDFNAQASTITVSLARRGVLCGSDHYQEIKKLSDDLAREAISTIQKASFSIAASGLPVNPNEWNVIYAKWRIDLKALMDERYTSRLTTCSEASLLASQRAAIAAAIEDELKIATELLRSFGLLT